MIETSVLREILATYRKYGWLLRRVLLKPGTRPQLMEGIDQPLDDVVISESEIDAVWFSRPPKEGPIAWEIRHLSETPYALLEMLDENDPRFEESLNEIEVRLQKAVTAERTTLTSAGDGRQT